MEAPIRGEEINHGDFSEIPPRASAVLHSLRSVGYDLPTALADIIDNSLSAGARLVSVSFCFAAADSYIRVADDGDGMSEARLESAMRLGSTHPAEDRQRSDHGRFGLGLKTASFSQCRRLTVRSRAQGGEEHTRSWDLDHIERHDQWQLRRGCWDQTSEARAGHLDAGAKGTIVLWEKLDRVVEGVGRSGAHEDFDRKIRETADHLSMVFHRLIDAKEGAVRIEVNGVTLIGWDPLLSRHPRTRSLPPVRLPVNNAVISVFPYLIPTEDQLSPEERQRAAGPHGWLAHQGFYLYRNRRLLVTGGWLGLARREAQCSLVRIRLDVDNTLDEVLRIDIRKARAHIPDRVRATLMTRMEAARTEGSKLWNQNVAVRGAGKAQAGEVVPVWIAEAGAGVPRFRVNGEHPAVLAVRAGLSGSPEGFDAMLALLGNALPVAMLMQMSGASAPTPQAVGVAPVAPVSDELRRLTKAALGWMRRDGVSAAQVAACLVLVEPWSALPAETLRQLIEEIT